MPPLGRSLVHFDREKLGRLKDATKRAVAAGRDSFMFEGNQYLVSYAKYLAEYLDTQLRRGPNPR
jgi:hypothetical protein